MADHEALPMWRSRLRWRLRGAWQWPAFAVLTVVDAVVLSVLPFAGEGSDLVPAVLLAGFLNLLVVAVVAPLAGWVLRRREPGLPKVVANDRAGTTGLVAMTLVLLAGGLVHRPAVRAQERDFDVQLAAARKWVAHHAPAEYQAGLMLADTWKQGPDVYRTCFPGNDPRRHLCLVVRTDEAVPIVRRDADQRPNATVAGPDNPGRRGG
ncbi:MAG: APC family permease [Solirubrobacterales bacterium]|nr:APC family permease [Solirubrobacterales bacterium]